MIVAKTKQPAKPLGVGKSDFEIQIKILYIKSLTPSLNIPIINKGSTHYLKLSGPSQLAKQAKLGKC